MHITTYRGWPVEEEKHRLLQWSSWVFQPEKKCSLSEGYTPVTQVSFLLAPSFHCPLLLWLWMLLLCFWLTLLSLHSQSSTAHQCPVVLRCPQPLAVPQTGRTAVTYSHPLVKKSLLVSFCWAFASWRTPCKLPKCWMRRTLGCIILQSSRYPALYLLCLPWGGCIPPGLPKRLATNLGRDKGLN